MRKKIIIPLMNRARSPFKSKDLKNPLEDLGYGVNIRLCFDVELVAGLFINT